MVNLYLLLGNIRIFFGMDYKGVWLGSFDRVLRKV